MQKNKAPTSPPSQTTPSKGRWTTKGGKARRTEKATNQPLLAESHPKAWEEKWGKPTPEKWCVRTPEGQAERSFDQNPRKGIQKKKTGKDCD